ncbi:MAG: FAD-binding oxidoreductase [Acidimicrobiia bacterium]
MTTVVSPETVDDAADAIREAAADLQTIRFAGSRSRQGLGGIGDGDVRIDTAGMKGVVEWLVEDLTIVVEAGMPVGEVEHLVGTKGLTTLLPVDEPNRTVGGLIAEGASGHARLKYGPTRDRVLEVTMATGYGKVVRGGGRLVKNVTGYDLPRLVTGSLGSLGLIGTICLKLWPLPPLRRTVVVDDPAHALRVLFRPAAILETEVLSFAVLEGNEPHVDAQMALVGASTQTKPPEAINSPIRLSVRVPPAHVTDTVSRVRRLGAERFVAQHGVGVVDAGFAAIRPEEVLELRARTELVGGSLVVTAPGLALATVDPWGTPRDTLEIQRRMKALFDPRGVCNPGILPGGL